MLALSILYVEVDIATSFDEFGLRPQNDEGPARAGPSLLLR